MTIKPYQVYFFIPNIIGYLRILSCSAAYYYAFTNPTLAIVLYAIGAGLDAVDGTAARHFNQCSKLGWLLDMLTDRMGTCVLFVILALLYEKYWAFFAFLIVLDTVSHWFQMITTLLLGKTSHKGSESSMLLNFYYSHPTLLIACCGNEIFIMALYLMAHFDHPAIFYTAVACFPIFLFKQLMNFVQLFDCTNKLVEIDAKEYNAAEKKRADEKEFAQKMALLSPQKNTTSGTGSTVETRRQSSALLNVPAAPPVDGHGHSHGPGGTCNHAH